MSLKYLLCLLALICNFAKADQLEYFIESITEQDKVASWIQTTTKGKVVESEAKTIVRDAYANSFSKNLDPKLVVVIMKIESNFRSRVTSSAGAKGIMQVMPRFHKDKLLGRDPFLNKVSTEVGTTVLKDCMIKHKNYLQKALDCYSGGSKTYHAKVMKYKFDMAQTFKPIGEILALNP